jgi:hypothetical protein
MIKYLADSSIDPGSVIHYLIVFKPFDDGALRKSSPSLHG